MDNAIYDHKIYNLYNISNFKELELNNILKP